MTTARGSEVLALWWLVAWTGGEDGRVLRGDQGVQVLHGHIQHHLPCHPQSLRGQCLPLDYRHPIPLRSWTYISPPANKVLTLYLTSPGCLSARSRRRREGTAPSTSSAWATSTRSWLSRKANCTAPALPQEWMSARVGRTSQVSLASHHIVHMSGDALMPLLDSQYGICCHYHYIIFKASSNYRQCLRCRHDFCLGACVANPFLLSLS